MRGAVARSAGLFLADITWMSVTNIYYEMGPPSTSGNSQPMTPPAVAPL